MAALVEKVRRLLAHRYTPFFLPVVGTLAYVGFSILLVPSDLSASREGSSDDEATETAADASAAPGSALPGSAAMTASSKRRARLAARAAQSQSAGGIGVPGAMQAPVQPPPAPLPASPDGAD